MWTVANSHQNTLHFQAEKIRSRYRSWAKIIRFYILFGKYHRLYKRLKWHIHLYEIGWDGATVPQVIDLTPEYGTINHLAVSSENLFACVTTGKNSLKQIQMKTHKIISIFWLQDNLLIKFLPDRLQQVRQWPGTLDNLASADQKFTLVSLNPNQILSSTRKQAKTI